MLDWALGFTYPDIHPTWWIRSGYGWEEMGGECTRAWLYALGDWWIRNQTSFCNDRRSTWGRFDMRVDHSEISGTLEQLSFSSHRLYVCHDAQPERSWEAVTFAWNSIDIWSLASLTCVNQTLVPDYHLTLILTRGAQVWLSIMQCYVITVACWRECRKVWAGRIPTLLISVRT